MCTKLNKVKDEYFKNDVMMSELLRHNDFANLREDEKFYLLEWAGESDIEV